MAVEEENRILIVDDEPINLKVLAAILEDDYAVSEAQNGAEALRAASASTAFCAAISRLRSTVASRFFASAEASP